MHKPLIETETFEQLRPSSHAKGAPISDNRDRLLEQVLQLGVGGTGRDEQPGARTARRAAFPSTLCDAVTMAAARAALGYDTLPEDLRNAVAECRAITGEVIIAATCA